MHSEGGPIECGRRVREARARLRRTTHAEYGVTRPVKWG